MDAIIYRTLALTVIAAVVAIAARRLRLPYTVGLVLSGAMLSVFPINTGIVLTHDLVFDLLLPPLLFEAALKLEWHHLRRDLLPVLVLAVVGVIISAGVVAVGMHAAVNWPVRDAMIFGILIAATDPVAVIAMLKDAGMKGRRRLLVEGESLFNDGVAAVLFGIALSPPPHDTQRLSEIAVALVTTAGGGIAIGLLIGSAALILAGRTQEYVVEGAVTAIAAYGAFLLADYLNVSGVLATVAAGLLVGNIGLGSRPSKWGLSDQGRVHVVALWDFAAFLANSFVFQLIGLSTAKIPFGSVGVWTIIAGIGTVLLARAATVYPISFAFRRSHWRIPMADQHILWLGGLRGALGLALVLTLPSGLPFRNAIVIVTFVVVAFSILVQGLSMKLLLARLRN